MISRFMKLCGCLAIVVICAIGCSDSARDDAARQDLALGADRNSAPMVLDWDDLMPPGENAILEELFEDYFSDLELRMLSNQRSLTSLSDPVTEIGEIEEGSDLDTMPQIGTFNTVDMLDGEVVRLPGYIIPLDYAAEGRLRSFLIVPYFGACIHTPPPPPNQIVYAEGDVAVSQDDIWLPYWVEGQLTVERAETDLANAAYSLSLHRLEVFDD